MTEGGGLRVPGWAFGGLVALSLAATGGLVTLVSRVSAIEMKQSLVTTEVYRRLDRIEAKLDEALRLEGRPR